MAEAKRKLAAILAADVAGYSRLMGRDEEGTINALNESRLVFRQAAGAHNGRIVDTAGDSVLALFESAVEAVRAGIDAQAALSERNADIPDDEKMMFRIGVNLGDIVEQDDGTIYGEGVNIAARLESLAQPGGIIVSELVHMYVSNKIDVGYQDVGAHSVKNIAEPVRAYRVTTEMGGDSIKTSVGWSGRKRRALWAVGTAAVIAIAVAGAIIQRSSEVPETAADPILAIPEGPVVAVLPFDNLSGNVEQDYFSDGLTEDLITGLSQFSDLFVIGRNTTFQFKGQAIDARSVAQQLGARYVVEGSVRRGGDTIRVNAQLLDGKSGNHLWAETFDRDLNAAEIFALQDEITAQIIGAIAGSYGVISRTRLVSAKAAGTDNLESYDCVLQAYAYEHRLNPKAHAVVRDCLERAVERDPDYAEAWSKLSFVYTDEHAFSFNPRPGSLDRALRTAERAVEIDPSSQITIWHLARTHFWRNEVDIAVAMFERALASNPNNSFVLAATGVYMAWTGRENRRWAKALAEKALLIDPNPPGWYQVPVIGYHYENRDYEAALAATLKYDILGYYWTYFWRAAIYGQLGRMSDGAEAISSLLELYPTFPERVRYEMDKLNSDSAFAEHLVEGLRKAGLDIPNEPMPTE